MCSRGSPRRFYQQNSSSFVLSELKSDPYRKEDLVYLEDVKDTVESAKENDEDKETEGEEETREGSQREQESLLDRLQQLVNKLIYSFLLRF